MNRYREIIGRINFGMFMVGVALLPFPQIALRYAYTIWIATWLLEGRWLHKPKPLSQNKTAIPFLLFGLWFAWKAISGLWAADQAAWGWQMERYLSFALIIPAGVWGMNQYYNWKKISQVFVISCVIAVPFYLAVFVPLFYHREIIDYLQWRAEWDYSPLTWYGFFAANISILKHRLFLCSVEMLGIFIALQIWREKKWLLALTLPIMLSIIPLSGSRQSVLTFAALLVVWIICSLPAAQRRRYGVGIILAGVVIGGALLAFHPRMQEFNFRDIANMRELSYSHDVRMNVYGCALQRPGDYLAYGLGAGQSAGYMENMYRELGFEPLAGLHRHPHNQYLEELMEIGIPGLIIFLIAWLSIPYCIPRRNRKMAWLFVTLFLLNMFTDGMFDMFDGIALWAAVLLMISFQTDPQREE